MSEQVHDAFRGSRQGRHEDDMDAPIDVAYDDASDVSSITYRLHPLDVGWDLRGECSRVEIDFAAPRLRVSYARRRDGERRVIEGPATAVIAWLRREGYRIVEARS